jgi:2-oxoglutarate dehydrogenase E2 component (dihydrolipoamide succinyltransferase)
MAESITEGTLVQLTKQIGDYVAQDEEIATIETDKIDVSVNAPHSGVIQRLLASEGDTVTVDQSIVELQRADSTSSEKSSSTEKQECDSEIAKRERETATEPVVSPKNRPSSTEFQQNTTSHPAKGSRPIQDAVREEPGSRSKHERGETRVCIAYFVIHTNHETF